MSRFVPYLKEIHDRLDLPQPAKSRILLEIAADLEDAYDLYLSRGIADEEAAQMAMERFGLSDEAFEELIRIHESPFRRFLSLFSEQARSRWERMILAALLVFIALFAGREAVTAGFLAHASAFIWPILGISFGALVLFLTRAYSLFLKQDHNPRRLRNKLSTLLALAGVNLLIGGYGFGLEFYLTVRRTAGDVENMAVYIVEWLFRAAPMLMAGLLTAVFIGLAWFVLESKISRIEQAEASLLLEA